MRQFMGRENLQNLDANRSHEPEPLLSRPSGTLSSIPNGGEGWGEEVLRFMESWKQSWLHHDGPSHRVVLGDRFGLVGADVRFECRAAGCA